MSSVIILCMPIYISEILEAFKLTGVVSKRVTKIIIKVIEKRIISFFHNFISNHLAHMLFFIYNFHSPSHQYRLFAFCFHEIARLIIFIYYGLVTGTSVCIVLRKFFFDFTQQKIIGIRFRHILIVFIDNNLPPSTSTLCSCSYLPHKYANNPLAHLYLQKNTC